MYYKVCTLTHMPTWCNQTFSANADDGTPQKTAAIQHWAPGFPQGGETKPCVVFNFGDVSGAHPAGFWENVECSTMAEAICESQV